MQRGARGRHIAQLAESKRLAVACIAFGLRSEDERKAELKWLDKLISELGRQRDPETSSHVHVAGEL